MRWRTVGGGLVLLANLGLLGFVGWRVWSRYVGPYAGYRKPTRALLAAATGSDTAALRRVASPRVATTLLDLARKHPEQLGGVGNLTIQRGERSGDTTRVTFFTRGCPRGLLTVTFVSTGGGPRVDDVTLPCPTVAAAPPIARADPER